jgi:hypothetical protein
MLVKQYMEGGKEVEIHELEITRQVKEVFLSNGIEPDHELIKRCVIECIAWNNKRRDLEKQEHEEEKNDEISIRTTQAFGRDYRGEEINQNKKNPDEQVPGLFKDRP